MSEITISPAKAETRTQAVPLLDLRAQYRNIREEVRAAIDRVAEAQHFILGPEVESFETEIALYSQCEFSVGVSSGSDALLISLMAVGLRPNEEVICPAYTFFATAGAVSRLGAVPVFIDIDPVSYNLDPDAIESAITDKTRAIIPVHLFGCMADMTPILEVARKYKLCVIEDAAQAIGAEVHGKRAGSLGDTGCFSFFPSKNLGGFGDGGLVTTNDPQLADRIKLLRNHGYRPKYYNKVVGGNFRLDAIQAAVLRVKLKYLDSWTEARQRNANLYRQKFWEANLVVPSQPDRFQVVLPEKGNDCRHIYNQFVIRNGARDELLEFLRRRQIGTEIYYPVPLHLQECFADLGHQPGDFPVSERAAKETLALPIYPELTEQMIETVVGAIADFCHT